MSSADAVQDIAFILSHYHELEHRYAGKAQEVQRLLDRLRSQGDEIVPHIVAAVTQCAREGHAGSSWPEGAIKLCGVLEGRVFLGSRVAKDALIEIEKTDSAIVEFDRVREAAKWSLRTSGSSVPEGPDAIIQHGRTLSPDEAAIKYFKTQLASVPTWPPEKQGGFYYFYGKKVERRSGLNKAKPLFAAALVANPDPNSAAWLHFPESPKTPEAAQSLAKKYPFRKGASRSWRFWK